ncbi:MAG: ATP-binding cassette domain-containing protein [Deltaproteobacteria bacterium]|nr:ATP-binding cassette domain-containing protein [Deltaproteobacteria bacterium]
MTLLNINNLTLRYPIADCPAISDLDFSVDAGQTVYLTGPSGSGKTSLLRALNGLAWSQFGAKITGDINFKGQALYGRSLRDIAQHIRTLFQEPDSQFFALTCRDDFLLTMECNLMDKDKALDLYAYWAKKLSLEHLGDRPVHLLSSGEKQKAVLMVLLALSPSLILLDEPTANLDEESVKELARCLFEIRKAGVAVIVSDHRRSWLGPFVDKAVVLQKGALAYIGPLEELNKFEVAEKLGLRREIKETKILTEPVDMGAAVVKAKNLGFSYKGGPELFKDFNLNLPAGKVTAITGPNGSGKTTIMRLIAGLLKAKSGGVYFKDKLVSRRYRLAQSSLALQNADHQLVMSSVASELTAAAPDRFSLSDSVTAELKLWDLAGLEERHPQSLSGGERQRLVLACAMARKSKVLILDEPSSGLDNHNLNLLARNLKKYIGEETTALLITHDRDLIDLAADYERKL